MPMKTITEHRKAMSDVGISTLKMQDADVARYLDRVGVEYAKPKSMAEEWAEKMWDQNGGGYGHTARFIFQGNRGGQVIEAFSAANLICETCVWLTAFEAAVREDERGKRPTREEFEAVRV